MQQIAPALVLVAASLAVAQEAPPAVSTSANAPADVASEKPAKKALAESEGIWPSPKLLRIMLSRWVEEACEEYDLDPEQRETVRKQAVDSWAEFLTENREDIQPLANEFMEMRLELKPPDDERVEAWADRALPVFDRTREHIGKSHDEFRKVLRPMQRAKFEVDALKMGAGMAIAEQKLKQWKQGDVDEDLIWEGLPKDRQERREERRRRRQEAETEAAAQVAASEPTDQIAVELDRWDKYVADFVRSFRLDEGQRTAALSFLSELKERAVAHRDRRREEIAQLERSIESFSGSDAALDELKKKLAELYGPIDEMFKELQARLGGLPTTEQRSTVAAERPADAAPATTPAPAPSP